ncbi:MULTISPECIES: HGxxPAAW family protein [unclassified Knoellia]|uniref:HGxxPAAW family protein n=1 Tax=Knoellia altitudinis TaxID=3404795 RepID=UPI00360E0A35
MAEHDDDNHGNSVAAWVMVGIIILASAVMAVAMIFPNLPLFIGGVVLVVVGLVAGKVLALAGYGVNGAISRRDTNIS